MTADESTWMADWSVGVRVWVERAGQAVLGPDRLELLEQIERCHSISGAARQVGISYRHAWVLVQAVNQAAGELLVEAAAGGSHGGGARLTPRGRLAVAVFRELQDQVRRTAASQLSRLVPPSARPEVHVAAAVSLEEVVEQLLTDYALRQPTVPVRVVFGASDELADQILGGASADLFLAADVRQLERLEVAGCLEPGTHTPLAANALVVVGPADRDVGVRRPDDLLGPDVTRIALAAASSPLGGYTRAYLERIGLYAEVLRRSVVLENARAVLAAVQAGQADVGLVYGSAAGPRSGCRVLFRVRRLPAPIRYAGAVVRRGRQPEEARSLLQFLTSAAARRRFRRCGFLPLRADR